MIGLTGRYKRPNSLNTFCFQTNGGQLNEEDIEGAEAAVYWQSAASLTIGPPFLLFLPQNFPPKLLRSIYCTNGSQADNWEVAEEIPGKGNERGMNIKSFQVVNNVARGFSAVPRVVEGQRGRIKFDWSRKGYKCICGQC